MSELQNEKVINVQETKVTCFWGWSVAEMGQDEGRGLGLCSSPLSSPS